MRHENSRFDFHQVVESRERGGAYKGQETQPCLEQRFETSSVSQLTCANYVKSTTAAKKDQHTEQAIGQVRVNAQPAAVNNE